MTFRKATESDIDAIAEIYEEIHDEIEAGRIVNGWVRGVYPIRLDAEEALEKGELFVEEEAGRIVAVGRINREQMDAYAQADWAWDAPADQVLVLHTLAVSPGAAGRGYGTAFVRFYEEQARERGCLYLRMDTGEVNQAARSLYKKLGYREAGIVPTVFNGIPGIHLVCLEKRI